MLASASAWRESQVNQGKAVLLHTDHLPVVVCVRQRDMCVWDESFSQEMGANYGTWNGEP